jgi:hypothetical protein
MQVRKGNPPAMVERPVEVDLSREEVLTVIVNYVKAKLGVNYNFNDIKVAGDEHDKLQSVSISGSEIIPLTWKADDATSTVKPVPTPVTTPPTPPFVKPK